MTDEIRFIAEIRDKRGRVVKRSGAYSSREDAARAIFFTRPRAKRCSTSRASFVGGQWRTFGFDIRWHDRHTVETH
jgi:hypothetical protein